MNRIWIVGMGLLAGTSLLVGASTFQQTGTVTGIVRNPETKEPIDSVSVALVATTIARGRGTAQDQFEALVATTAARGRGAAQNGSSQFQAITDSNGRFTFSNVPLGNYTVRADREGYFASSDQLRAPTTVSAPVNVSGPMPANVVLELSPGGIIRGHVYDAGGRVVASAQVSSLRSSYQDGRLVLSSSKNETTDERGEFRIWGLAPGTYYLRSQLRTNAARNQPGLVAYYPNDIDASRAQSIGVRSGQEFVADIHLPSATPFQVSGRVVGMDTTAGPVAAFLIRRDSEVWDTSEVRAPILNAQRGRSDGPVTFQFQAPIPGRYEVFAVQQLAAGRGSSPLERSSLVERASIDVIDRNIEDLTVSLRPTFDLEVRFVGSGAAQISNQLTNVDLRSRDQLPPTLMTLNATRVAGNVAAAGLTGAAAAQARAASQSTLPNVAKFSGLIEGRYFIEGSLGSLRDAYIADIRQGAKSIYEDGTIVVGTTPPEPVELILDRPAGVIQGTVQDATNKPVGSALVVLIPDGRRRENPLFYKRATTSADGVFALSALAPGQYKIFAWESFPSGAERNAQFLAPFEQFGRSVTVDAGATVSGAVVPIIRDRR